MLVTNFTTFSWDKTSAKVSSLVARLKIKDNNGNEITLRNLPSPVEINLPQREQRDELQNTTYTLAFGRTVYHEVEVKSVEKSLLIKLIPHDNNTRIVLAVQFQERPKRAEDFVFAFPQDSEFSNTSLNSSRVSDPYTLRIGSPYISKAGTYFIGVRIGLDLDRLKVNQTELKANFRTSVKYELETRDAECLFWQQEKQKWISNGCKVSLCYYNRVRISTENSQTNNATHCANNAHKY
jgi:hypothetical protein